MNLRPVDKPTPCPSCGIVLKTAEWIRNARPEAGTLGMCGHCFHICTFTADGGVVTAPPEVLRAIAKEDPDAWNAFQAQVSELRLAANGLPMPGGLGDLAQSLGTGKVKKLSDDSYEWELPNGKTGNAATPGEAVIAMIQAAANQPRNRIE